MHGYEAVSALGRGSGLDLASAFSHMAFLSSGVLHYEEANTGHLPEWLEVGKSGVLNTGSPVSTLESSHYNSAHAQLAPELATTLLLPGLLMAVLHVVSGFMGGQRDPVNTAARSHPSLLRALQ